MKRKRKTGLLPDVSILIVTVLAITAFLRGTWQFWMLVAAFAAWSAWAIYRHLIPFLREEMARREARQIRRHYEQIQQKKNSIIDIDLSDPVSIVLLRHVNHRISAYLQSVYPDATWEWSCNDPEMIVAKGGTGRIRLSGAADYNYAEISLDQDAKIDCQLLKIVPFTSDTTVPSEAAQESASKPREIDPQVWYEEKGKLVLTNLIADLASRGHSSLTIQEDGSISIQQANKEMKRPAFESVPERTYWPRLVKVFEREGIASSITTQGIVLSW